MTLRGGRHGSLFPIVVTALAFSKSKVTAGPGGRYNSSYRSCCCSSGQPGSSQPNTIVGTAKADTIHGTACNDNIKGLGGGDHLYGGDGSDEISGGSAPPGEVDWIYGSDGSDRIFGGPGVDHVKGGNQNDVIEGGASYDWISGGDGDDVIKGSGGYDALIGGDGDDFLSVGSGVLDKYQSVYPGTGTNTIVLNDPAVPGVNRVTFWSKEVAADAAADLPYDTVKNFVALRGDVIYTNFYDGGGPPFDMFGVDGEFLTFTREGGVVYKYAHVEGVDLLPLLNENVGMIGGYYQTGG